MVKEGETSATAEPDAELTLEEQACLHEPYDHGAVVRRGSEVTVVDYEKAKADAFASKRKLAQPGITEEEREYYTDKFQGILGGWATKNG
jgi:pyruvate/2-oxoglutarate/acetoin dehydrogenase E1 component